MIADLRKEQIDGWAEWFANQGKRCAPRKFSLWIGDEVGTQMELVVDEHKIELLQKDPFFARPIPMAEGAGSEYLKKLATFANFLAKEIAKKEGPSQVYTWSWEAWEEAMQEGGYSMDFDYFDNVLNLYVFGYGEVTLTEWIDGYSGDEFNTLAKGHGHEYLLHLGIFAIELKSIIGSQYGKYVLYEPDGRRCAAIEIRHTWN
jgi:hypothetical protein